MSQSNNREQTLNLIAKLLKSDGNFREDANLDEMTINELEFYSNIIPTYEELLRTTGSFLLDCTPKFYFGFYDIVKGDEDQ
jgi:hypothetical protein